MVVPANTTLGRSCNSRSERAGLLLCIEPDDGAVVGNTSQIYFHFGWTNNDVFALLLLFYWLVPSRSKHLSASSTSWLLCLWGAAAAAQIVSTSRAHLLCTSRWRCITCAQPSDHFSGFDGRIDHSCTIAGGGRSPRGRRMTLEVVLGRCGGGRPWFWWLRGLEMSPMSEKFSLKN